MVPSIACSILLLLTQSAPAETLQHRTIRTLGHVTVKHRTLNGRAPGPEAALGVARGALGWQTIASNDFEGSFPGSWIVFDDQPGGGEYAWNKSQCRAYEGHYSAWALGGGADGGSLACGSDYPNGARSFMVYGPFSLENATAAELAFRLWLNAESGYDFLYAMASVDGLEFYGPGVSGSSDGWEQHALDLSDVHTLGSLLGQERVWIAFAFISDDSIGRSEGAYVDNVVLRKHVGPLENTPTATRTPTRTRTPTPSPTLAAALKAYLPIIARPGRPTGTPTSTISATATGGPALTPTATRPPGAGCPHTGRWSGTTSDGHVVTLHLSDQPQCQVSDMDIVVWCPRFAWLAEPEPAPIVNGHFEAFAHNDFQEADIHVTGDFLSATEVIGTWYVSHDCQGTWSANYSPEDT